MVLEAEALAHKVTSFGLSRKFPTRVLNREIHSAAALKQLKTNGTSVLYGQPRERWRASRFLRRNCYELSHRGPPLEVKMFLMARVERHITVLTVNAELDTWLKSRSYIRIWQMSVKTLSCTPLHQCVTSKSFIRFIRPPQNATFDKRNLIT